MKRNFIHGCLVGFVAAACPLSSRGELMFEPRAPLFSEAEVGIIARNAILAERLSSDPWLVRHIIDLLETKGEAESGQPGAGGRDLARAKPEPDTTAEPVDPAANPDLANLERSSAEAAYDLLLLLKQAGKATQPTTPAPAPK